MIRRFERLESRRVLAPLPISLGCACKVNANSAWLARGEFAEISPAASIVDIERAVGSDWVRVTTRCPVTENEAFHALSQVGRVDAIENDIVLTSALSVNDPLAGELYGLTQLEVERAWEAGVTGGGTVVAVLDSGVDMSHSDLAGNIWQNAGEIPGNGVDDDGNGFIDDQFGWDFFSDDNVPADENGHGTHVAGTIAAAKNNLTGVVGVAPDTKVLPLRFLGASGSGSVYDAVQAITYATNLKLDGAANIVAINASWGASAPSAALTEAIAAAGDAGILFVAAAGNAAQNNDLTPTYPANSDAWNVVTVTATDAGNDLAGFSNFGSSVDIAAPGVGILSSVPGQVYESYSGTSMAAPHVSGTIALVASAAPDASAGELRQRLLASGDPLVSLTGRIAGGNRVNAGRAVLGTPPPPPPIPPITPPRPDVYLDDGVVRITIDQVAASVLVTQNGRESYTFSVNGKTHQFRWWEVLRIEATLGAGDDYFENASDLPSRVEGGEGNDTLIGGSSTDKLFGQLGDDLLLGREGADVLRGGLGRDELRGGRGADELRGGRGRDTLIGGRGADQLDGGAGADRLYVDNEDMTDGDRSDRVLS